MASTLFVPPCLGLSVVPADVILAVDRIVFLELDEGDEYRAGLALSDEEFKAYRESRG